ncbi:site-specific integrase [Levilactobacillus brevis]|uniref:site-specific integrase n=1 Tax=Levilactobacillus brevis TaxID=1580 RepID=UPI000BE83C7F|nr:site-specific integrase [Levilactobacillus brevis]STX20425.1 Phage integrase [Levilactobacillus brevis]
MASITKRGKSWQARISYKDTDGKAKIKTHGGFRTKGEATAWANQFSVDRNSGKLVMAEVPYFKDYFWEWYKTYKEPGVKERTRLTYELSHKILSEGLPFARLDTITRYDYQNFIRDIGQTRSKETMAKLSSQYHACIKNAIYDGIITKDFAYNVTMVYDKNRTRKIQYLNEKQLKQLSAYLLKTRRPKFTGKYMILTALDTGMRPGEVEGLKWSSIHFDTGMIDVKNSWNESTQDFEDVKNEWSFRTIRANHWLLDVLKELPQDNPRGLVFAENDTIPTSAGINKVLRNALKEIGSPLKGFHFHSCRHTHVAYLLGQGVDLYAISKRLGHSSIVITANRYAYMIDEYKSRTDQKIIDSLDTLYKPAYEFKVVNRSFKLDAQRLRKVFLSSSSF